MAWELPRSLQAGLHDASDPTGVPFGAIVAAVLVVLLLAIFSLAVRWSVEGIGQPQVASARQ